VAPRTQRAERSGIEQTREGAIRAQKMILPDDLAEHARPQPVGERRGALRSSPAAANRLGDPFAPRAWRAVSSPQLHGHLLAAAHDGDAPQSALLAGDALEVAGLGDVGVVDGKHEVAALEPKALCKRAIGDVDDDHALGSRVEPQIVGERRRQVGDLGALERRRRRNDELVMRVSGAASSATFTATSLPARMTPIRALPPIALVAKR